MPPWKKIGQVLLGLGKSGLIPIPGLPAAIDGIEAAFPPKSGVTKLAAADAIADALIGASKDLGALTAEQSAELQRLKTAYINDYVAARNLESQMEADAKALKSFIDGLHPAPPPSA